VETSEALNGCVDQVSNVVNLSDICGYEDRAPGTLAVDLGLERLALLLIARAEHDIRAPLFNENLHASLADSPAPTRDDRDPVLVAHPPLILTAASDYGAALDAQQCRVFTAAGR